MAKFIGYTTCPRCADRGRDRGGDNLAQYSDGGGHCFSCGYHVFPKRHIKVDHEEVRTADKTLLPYDASKHIPARAWKWLLQYGLGIQYWQQYVEFSESEQRLLFKVGDPLEFSIGRYFGEEADHRKWYVYGDSHRTAHLFPGKLRQDKIVLVEDLISAHKVGHITNCIPLFGTNVFDSVTNALRLYRKPVVMWLDKDQQDHARKRAARLSGITGCDVTYVFTDNDPKELSFQTIQEVLYEN